MDGTYKVVVGDRGRLVIPSEVRGRAGLVEGTALTLIESEAGLVLLTREQLRDRVQRDLRGLDLVSSLIEERRREATREQEDDSGHAAA